MSELELFEGLGFPDRDRVPGPGLTVITTPITVKVAGDYVVGYGVFMPLGPARTVVVGYETEVTYRDDNGTLWRCAGPPPFTGDDWWMTEATDYQPWLDGPQPCPAGARAQLEEIFGGTT